MVDMEVHTIAPVLVEADMILIIELYCTIAVDDKLRLQKLVMKVDFVQIQRIEE